MSGLRRDREGVFHVSMCVWERWDPAYGSPEAGPGGAPGPGHELEETEAIPVYYKDKEGADTKRIRPSYAQMRTYVFSSFVFAMSLVLMIVTVNYRRRCSSNDDIGSWWPPLKSNWSWYVPNVAGA